MTDAFTAKTADRHELYELSVQRPEVMIDFLEKVFEQVGDREPLTLREDFCGTAHLAATWVRTDARRRAVGVDVDPAIIEYAEGVNRRLLGDAAGRLRLACRDVLRCRARADVLTSLNFSHFIYKTRRELGRYLRHAHRCVREGGVMVLDCYGGPGSFVPGTDERDFGDFAYEWEQGTYDPLTNRVVNHIHFRFPDGTRMDRAFTYDWRLWSLVELQELLAEAGFDELSICFESEEGFIGDFDMSDADAWVAYLIAQKA